MVRFLGCVVLSLLMTVQTVPPVLACECVVVADCCGCLMEDVACESVEFASCDACETEFTVVEDCGCGNAKSPDEVTPKEEPAEPQSAQPQPAESQRPQTYTEPAQEQPTASTETPAPALDNTEVPLAPAPIAVPQDQPSDSAPATEQVVPGPAPEVTPPVEQPRQVNTEGLFDEPAPQTEPSPADTAPAPSAQEPAESTGTEGLFEEPSTQESTEESTGSASEGSPESEGEETDEAEPAADPLEGLFGPSSPSTEPEKEPAPESQPESSDETEESSNIDPFGQVLPVLKSAGGLASQEFRTWSNREATASYEARLVQFSPAGVLLTKFSGENVTMSFVQLSDADLAFVREQVRAQRAVLAEEAPTQVASNPR